MIRGLHAQLSPREEIVLRRIALGDDSRQLEAHVRRLDQLQLIERHRGVWRLTPLGRQRHDILEKPPLMKSPASVEIDRIFSKRAKGGPEISKGPGVDK